MSNDYYVEFGSNARPWAKGLKAELAPAREAVQEVLDLLATMESKVGPETRRQREELGQRFRGGGTGAGADGSGVDMSSLRVAVHELADESAAAGALIKTAAIDLGRTITKIATLPASIEKSVSTSMASISGSIARLVEQNTGKGRHYLPSEPNRYVSADTPGAVQHGSLTGEFFKSLREIRQGTFQPRVDLTPKPSIATVSAAALDRAGVDRIVNAVRAQTRVLSADIRGLGGRPPGGGSSTGTPPTAPPTAPAPTTSPAKSGRPSISTAAAAVTQESQKEINALEARLKGQGEKIAQIMAALGDDVDEGMKAALGELEDARRATAAELEAIRSKAAGDARKAERETTGISRAEQSKRASEQFQAEQAARPVLTDTERDTRLRKQALLASPGQEDFLYKASRPPGVARAQRYNEPDLKEMAATFREFGVAVHATSKTSKADLAELLVQAHKTFSELYPDGVPDELRTDGARVTRTTKVGDELKSVLGDLNADVVEQRKADLRAMSQNLLTGGDKAEKVVRQDRLNDGTIVVPEDMVKGRRGFGAAISEDVRHPEFPDAAVGKIAGLIDAATVRAAESRMQTDPAREMARALANPGFNPYDVGLNRSIEQGQGEDEKAVAGAYRQRLRDLRAAYVELDKAGTAFHDSINLLKVLDDKLARSKERIAGLNSQRADASTSVERFAGTETPVTPAMRDKAIKRVDRQIESELADMAALRTQQDQVIAHSAQLGADGRRELFNSPEYKAGLAKREGFAGIPFAPGLGTRQIFEKNRDELPASSSLSDARLLRSATQAAVVGLQTANGTRELMKVVPGLRRRGDGLGADDSVRAPLSKTEQQQLDSAFNKLSSLQRKVIPNRTGIPDDAERAMDLQLEQAANHFNNVVERLFKSASLPIQAFTGQDPRTNEALVDEERRRTLREQREAERTKSVAQIRADQTPAYKKQQADLAVENARQALQNATERKATKSTIDTGGVGHVGKESGLTEAREKEAAAEVRLREVAQKAGISVQDLTRALSGFVKAEAEAFQTQLKANKLIEARRRIEDVANYDPLTGEASTKGLKIEGDGHGPGPIKTLDDAVRVLDQQVEQMSRQNTEMLRRKGEGKGVVDEELVASLDRARSEQAHLSGLRNEFGGDIPLTRLVERLEAQAASQRVAATLGITPDQEVEGTKPDRRHGLEGLNENDARRVGYAMGAYADAYQGLEAAEREVNDLTGSLKKAEAAADKAGRALDRDTKKRQTEADGRRKELQDSVAAERAKRQAIRAEGPYTRTDKKAAFQRGGIDDPQYQAIAERQRRLRRQELNVQTAERDLSAFNKTNPIPKTPRAAAGGGAAGGGTKPPAPPAGARPPGGGDDDELRRILSVLNQIHSTLKGTLRVTGKITDTGGPGKPKPGGDVPVSAATDASRAKTPRTRNETVVAIEEERQRQRERTLANVREKNTKNEERDSLKAAKAVEAQASADREAARAADDLASAVGQLSPSTKREIEALRQLTQASTTAATAQEREAASKRIAAQQTKVAAGVDRDLYANRIGSAGRRDATRVVLNDAGPGLGGGELDSVLRSVRSANPKQIGRGMGEEMGQGAIDGFQRIFGGGSSFWQRALHTTGTFVVRNFAAGFVFGLTNYFQQVLDQAIQAEATFVRVRSALEATGQDLGNIRSDLQGISTDYGVQLNDVYTAAAGLTGLFDNEDDLAAGTRVVAQLQAISGGALNATEATGVLASTISAFQRQAGETGDASRFLPDDTVEAVTHVADVLTAIQNTLGVNIETSAEGASRLAGLAREMSLSFEETAVFAAQIAKQTNQTGAAAGEQFSRIIGGVQSGRGRNALLEAFDPATSTASQAAVSQVRAGLDDGNMGQVFRGLIAGWDDLSTAQQRNLIVSIAGQRQAAAFSALLNDSGKTLNALERAENSQGAAASRMDDLMKTLNKRLDKFGSEVQTLASNLIQAGLLDFLGVLLVGVTGVLDVVNKLLTAFNQMTDSNGALDELRKYIAILLGGVLALRLFGAGLRGVSSSIRGLRAGAAAERTATGTGGVYPRNTVRYGPNGVREETTGAGRLSIANRFASGADSAYFKLQTMAVERAREAKRLRSVYQDQQLRERFGPSYVPTPKVGAPDYDDDELRQRTSRPDPRLLQQADSADRMARAAGRAGNGMGRVANGLDKMAKSGLAAEGAFAVLAIGFAAFMDAQNRQAEAARSFRQGYDKITEGYLVQTPAVYDSGLALLGLADAAKQFNANAPDPNRFYGPTYENYKNRIDSAGDQGFVGQAFSSIGAVINNPSTFFKNLGGGPGGGPGGLISANLKEQGLESRANGGYQAYGTDDAQKIYQNAKKELDALNLPSTEEVSKISKDYGRKIAEQAVEIKNDKDLSNTEKEAALGQLEVSSTLIADMVGDIAAVAAGAKNALGLSIADVQGIQTLVQTRQAIGSQVDSSGLDLGPYLQSLQEGTGAANAPGTNTKRLLDKITSENSDSIDILVANKALLKESIIQMTADLKALQEGGKGDSDEAQQIASQLGSLIQQYGQSNDQITSAILSEADAWSNELSSAGKPGQAMKVYANAIRRADSVYQQETRAARRAFRLLKLAAQSIQAQSAKVEAMLGESVDGIGPPHIRVPDKTRDQSKAEQQRKRAHRKELEEGFQKLVDQAIFRATNDLTIKIAQTADAAERAGLEFLKAQITHQIIAAVNGGKSPGYGIPPDLAANLGNATIDEQEWQNDQVNYYQAQQNLNQAQQDSGTSAAQRAAALRIAQLGVAQAWADARGDAVASARIQVAIARATIAAAKADLAAAKTADETNSARIAILSAQAQLIGAMAAVQAAQSDLVQSQYDVSIALAEAAGNTVKSARLTLAAARRALADALKRSGGEATAEVNAARVEAINARASLQDAVLQDQLDTVDFNLQMGRITQQSAIQALQQILRTSDLNKQQRRQLMLQIKGMKDELSDSQWNFGDISLPTPYQMKRYITERRNQFRNELDQAATGGIKPVGGDRPGPRDQRTTNTSTSTTTITIDGADTGMIKRLIREVVGDSGSINTRTTGARRGGY